MWGWGRKEKDIREGERNTRETGEGRGGGEREGKEVGEKWKKEEAVNKKRSINTVLVLHFALPVISYTIASSPQSQTVHAETHTNIIQRKNKCEEIEIKYVKM